MKALARLKSWLRSSSDREQVETDMDDELRFHIDQFTEDLVRKGVSLQEARRRAQLEFGAVDARKDECREALGLRLLDDLKADVRFAVRMLRQSPVFTAVAVLSLALGIGANTAIFSLMEAAIWKSTPVKNPDRLRLFQMVSGPKRAYNSSAGSGKLWEDGVYRGFPISYPVFEAFHKNPGQFESIFAYKNADRLTAVIDGNAELVSCYLVSGDFHRTLGASTAAGRPIVQEDDVRDAPEIAAVISDAYWARRFGRDASVIGKRILVNEAPVTIVGVNTADFTGPEARTNPDVYLPLAMQPRVYSWRYAVKTKGSLLDDPDYWWTVVMGRLKPGADEAAAQAELDRVLTDTVRATLPDRGNRDQPHLRLLPGRRGVDELARYLGPPLWVLLLFVALVLLIACANVANLLLARASVRQREVGVRLALGAGRARVMRQLLTEGLVLAAIAGAAGLGLGYAMRNAIPKLMETSWRPAPSYAEFDLRVVAAAVAISVLTGLLFSLAPAWQVRRVELNSTLKEGARSTIGGPRMMTKKLLVVFQVALSLLVVTGAGLFVRTLNNLKASPLGFRPEQILLFRMDPPRARYAGDALKDLYSRIERQIGEIPGVQSATLSDTALVAQDSSTTGIVPTGRTLPPGDARSSWIIVVGDRFFQTMGIPILQGRPIEERDQANSPPVAVVNQEFIKKFFPGENVLGKTFNWSDRSFEIVGVSANTRFNQVDVPMPPTFYPSYRQVRPQQIGAMEFEVKTAASTESMMRAVREAVRRIDPNLPVFDVRTQQAQIDATMSQQNLFATLTSALGALALMLTCVGIYGIMSQTVARRTNEIGIRMALGARAGQVLGMILGESGRLIVLGIVAGGAAAYWLASYVESMLYGVKGSDTATLAAAVGILCGVGLFAAWWPARRASRVEPMTALRHE